jgi:DNA ligase (NAD+)
LGLPVWSGRSVVEDLDGVWAYCTDMEAKRSTLPFEIDGVVVKVDPLRDQAELGSAGRDPRWAIAYKFAPVQATTKLLEIRIQVGRTGTLNPLAILEPVRVGGVMVSRATLHNEDEIARKGLMIGDTVIVQRAGDVIPQIVKSIPDRRTGDETPFAFPVTCPECGSEALKPEGQVMRYCTGGTACRAQLVEALKHFAGRRAMDIEGLGEKVAETLIEVGLVQDLSDVYTLTYDQVKGLDRFAPKSAQNLVDGIWKSKERGLARLLFGLGIRDVGEQTARLLVDRFGSVVKLRAATLDELKDVRGLGPIVATSVHEFFQQARNIAVLEKLAAAGMPMEEAAAAGSREGPFTGQTFVFTGRMVRTRHGDVTRARLPNTRAVQRRLRGRPGCSDDRPASLTRTVD